MKCPHCAKEHPDGAQFCPVTGMKITVIEPPIENAISEKTCPQCGRRVKENWVHCAYCSADLLTLQPTIEVPRKSKGISPSCLALIVAGALALVLLVVGGAFVLSNYQQATTWIGQLITGVSGESNGKQSQEESTDDEISPVDEPAYSTEIVITVEDTPAANTQSTLTPTLWATATQEFTSTITPSRTPFSTITVTKTPVLVGTWTPCTGIYASRLHVGDQAAVSTSPNLPNRVRIDPGLTTEIIGKISPGEKIKILDGPTCNNGVWWKVQSQKTGLLGWTLEGDNENYWLVPLP